MLAKLVWRVTECIDDIYLRLRKRRRPVHPFDVKLGIETSQRIYRSLLKSGNDADLFSVGYVGATPSIVRKSLDVIHVPSDAEFIDLGCGKGRVLIVAAEYPFRSITGIDLSRYACDRARRNVAKLPRTTYGDRIRILEGDASMPALPLAPCIVLFLYNSFRRPLVEVLVKHLETEFARVPTREVWIVYYNPVCFDLFDRSPWIQRYFAAKIEFDEEESRAAPTGNTADSVLIYYAGRDEREPLPGADANVVITIPHLGAEIV
jgi:SAM-dependent methyltransferase